jgi:hypothetical protein
LPKIKEREIILSHINLKISMNYPKIRQNAKQFLSITSLSVEKFDELLPRFQACWENYIHHYTLDGQPRVRAYVADENEFLPLVEEKLFFILAYQKNACLQEFFAASFDTEQSICNKWVHLLSPVLAASLLPHAPKRDPQEVDWQTDEDYLGDATERAIQRDTYQQEDYYSGKKKRHTVKNMAICAISGALLFLSPTVFGRIHDKKLMDMFELTTQNISLYLDLGFVGYQAGDKVNIILPHKKPRNTKTEKRTLTKEQKEYNQQHAKIRVKIENIFAHIKTMRILKDTLRNYKKGFRDLIMVTASALYNFRNGFLLN